LLLDGIRDRLASVVAPTLVLWGGADEILDPSAAPIFEEGLPDAVVEIVDGAGHTLHGDRPREVIARIERFLDDA
jgi:pimeloyl-ACP methyl ester carboxylesterase